MAARYFEGAAHAVVYSQFRPSPPASLISRILSFTREKYAGPLSSAVDVGCGSGQSTLPLAPYFKNVVGLDISQAQVNEAIKKNAATNVTYKMSPAESMPFESQSVQLVTAGQASHWFDFPKFYKEVERILVPNGVLAMYTYYFPRPIWKDKSDELFNILNNVYIKDKKYWGAERAFVDNCYSDKQFEIPFGEWIRSYILTIGLGSRNFAGEDDQTNRIIKEENFILENKGSVSDLAGYITTWSGFQGYKKAKGEEEGQKILDTFTNNMMKAIGETKNPDEIELALQFSFTVVLGRKSAS